MAFCKDCVSELYGILSDPEKAVLYFLYRRQKIVLDIQEKIGTAKGIIAAPSFDKISDFLSCTRSMSRNYVTFLYRLGLVSRSKEDHSWTYALTESGDDVIQLALQNGEEARLSLLFNKGLFFTFFLFNILEDGI